MGLRALAALVQPELRGRRLRTMVVLLVVVGLAATAIVAGLSTQEQAGSRWDAAFAESNGAHVTITSDHPAALSRVAADPRVVGRSQAYAVAFGVEVAQGARQLGETVVLGMGDRGRPTIARPRWGRSSSSPTRSAATSRTPGSWCARAG